MPGVAPGTRGVDTEDKRTQVYPGTRRKVDQQPVRWQVTVLRARTLDGRGETRRGTKSDYSLRDTRSSSVNTHRKGNEGRDTGGESETNVLEGKCLPELKKKNLISIPE